MLYAVFVGVCPQDNVLFDFLTVKEHLEFYCGLKGIEGEEADTRVNTFDFFSLLTLSRHIVIKKFCSGTPSAVALSLIVHSFEKNISFHFFEDPS